MLKFLKKETNKTYTENGAITWKSTESACLDLFSVIGACRRASERRIEDDFFRAFAENPDMAMKILFFARDVRGGLGERRVFRVILKQLAHRYPETVKKNIRYIAEYGRFDDLLMLLDTPCEADAVAYMKKQFRTDEAAMAAEKEISLLAKWLPSVNASNAETVRMGKKLAKAFGMQEAAYRKRVARLRKYLQIIENNLRERDYTFAYATVPSKALFRYRQAFYRNDAERYRAFLADVEQGKATMHTDTLTPYDIIAPFFADDCYFSDDCMMDAKEAKAIDITWNAQPDDTGGENALVVADGSGSMYDGNAMPAKVAQSLAIYFAERNTGVFRNHFITFSERPQLVEIKGEDIAQKLWHCMQYDEVANTNLQRVFELILQTAVKNHLPQEELPQTLYIISDMEFDYCVEGADLTNFAYAKKRFAKHGYRLPQVVFWNVASRNRQQPVTRNEQGVALVSGQSPRIFSMITNKEFSPHAFMLEVLQQERYQKICA